MCHMDSVVYCKYTLLTKVVRLFGETPYGEQPAAATKSSLAAQQGHSANLLSPSHAKNARYTSDHGSRLLVSAVI